MDIYGVGKTDLGLIRGNNEDSFFVSNEPVGVFPCLYIVADGIGGSLAGEVASERAIYFFGEFVKTAMNNGDILQIFDDALQYANNEVYKLAESSLDLKEMGTTFIAATIIDNKLIYIHIGDSRMYVIENGAIRQITEDHTFANIMLKTGAVTEEQAESLKNRNAIIKWIGAKGMVEPEINTIALNEDSKILICSDGLSDMLTEDDIMNIILSNTDVEGAAEELIRRANINGGRDNITVILINGEVRK